jgi:hypothetical protein
MEYVKAAINRRATQNLDIFAEPSTLERAYGSFRYK